MAPTTPSVQFVEMVHQENVEALYEKIIDAAVGIMHCDFASMQMLVPERRNGQGELFLLAHRGFAAKDANTWEWVSTDSHCICGEALRTGGRVIVPIAPGRETRSPRPSRGCAVMSKRSGSRG